MPIDPGEIYTTTEIAVRAPEPVEPAAVRATARLVCVAGSAVGRTIALGARPLTIGRNDDCDLVLDGNELSRVHARVEHRADGFFVVDLGSRNGTSVNQRRVRDERLHSGDRIQLGESTILLFSQQDELESRANRLQRLESLAQFAGGMVHDFKNTLGVVLMNAELLEADLTPGEVVTEETIAMVRDILEAGRKSFSVTQRLLYFARRQEHHATTAVDLAGIVDETLGMVRRGLEVTHGIKVAVDVEPGLVLRGDHDEIGHVLLNLVLNARDAMPQGGQLTISGVGRTLGRAPAFALQLPAPGPYVDLTVADTGIGMSDELQARIFDPFFTTKATGEGTGLGLSTVFGIVRSLGGNVLVESTPGQGSRFRVLLPRQSG